ncbi:hypothetical protein [Brachybacterium huguangmaarense]
MSTGHDDVRHDPNAGTETSRPRVGEIPPGTPASPAMDPNIAAVASDDPQTGPVPDTRTIDRPLLAAMFADQIRAAGLAADDTTLHGTMPDVVITLADLTPELLAEMTGLAVTIPPVPDAWGTLRDVRRDGDGYTVVFDEREVADLPPLTPLHVTARAWDEAGEGDVRAR